jgi:hypothetical protein
MESFAAEWTMFAEMAQNSSIVLLQLHLAPGATS